MMGMYTVDSAAWLGNWLIRSFPGSPSTCRSYTGKTLTVETAANPDSAQKASGHPHAHNLIPFQGCDTTTIEQCQPRRDSALTRYTYLLLLGSYWRQWKLSAGTEAEGTS
jgi:hypothetical protein